MALILNPSKIKVERVATDKLATELKPCCLCGELVEHAKIEGKNVHLVFRAHVDADGNVWSTLRNHGPESGCPNPDSWTRRIWVNDSEREAHKKLMRARALRRELSTIKRGTKNEV